MGHGSVTLDTVMIKVESNAGKATSSIDGLAQALGRLKSAVSGGFNNVNKLGDALVKLNKATDGLSKTVSGLAELSNVTDNLRELSTIDAPKGLNSTIKRLNELSKTTQTLSATADNVKSLSAIVPELSTLSTIKAPTGLTSVVRNMNELANMGNIDKMLEQIKDVPKLVEPLSSLGNIVNPKGMGNAIKNLQQLPDILNKLDTTAMENLKRVSTELSVSLTPLADKMKQVADGYSAFSKIQNTFGKSASTSVRYHKQQASVLGTIGNVIKSTSKGFINLAGAMAGVFGKSAQQNLKSFNSKFKQVYLSLLGTRTLFTMIRKAASEYQAFDQELQKFTQNIWRAFGAQLAPAIEYAMEIFKQFVRVVYSVIYALTGIDLIARANEKAMKGWGKSAKDTLGNLQKFDDLNVVEFPKGKGEGPDLIELEKIDLTPIQKVIDWVRKLKEEIKKALDTGDWEIVGEVFGKGISDGLEFVITKIPMLAKYLEDIAENFADFLNGAISTINWKSAGKTMSLLFKTAIDTFTKLFKKIKWKKVGSNFTDFVKGLDLSGMVSSITSNLSTITKGIETAIHNVDWTIIGSELGKAMLTFGRDLNDIIKRIDGEKLGADLKALILSIPWGDIFTEIVNILVSTLGLLGEFLEGMTGIDALTNLMTTIQNTSVNIDWGELTTSLTNLYNAILPFADNVGEGLEWLYINVLVPLAEYVVNDLVPTFIDTLAGAIDVLNIIIEAAKPSIIWMWDNFLNPLIEITKLTIVKLLEGLNSAFKNFSKWANDNEDLVTRITDTIVTFLELLALYLITKKLGTIFKTFGTIVAGAFTAINVPLLVTVGAFATLITSLKKLVENWNKLDGFEKVASVLGAVAAAAGAAAIAYGAFQSAVTAGIAAVAIVAGIVAIETSVNRATKRAKEQLNLTAGQSKPLFGYATGGFPEQGQYFYARENGIPEMVGTIGTKTAVANNTQIVEAISVGVEEAMINALSRENFSPNIIVNVGNKKLYEGQQAFNKTQQNKYGTINLY